MHKLLLLVLLLFPSFVYSKYYDNNIMTIEAKLFPKILVLEESIKENSSGKLIIAIVANKENLYAAMIFKNKILSNYPNTIDGKKVTVYVSNFKNLNKEHIDGIIVLGHASEELKEIALWANQNKIVSFVYDYSNLKYGFLASIYIGKTTKPYLNKSTILKYNFTFDAYLLQLSKINSI